MRVACSQDWTSTNTKVLHGSLAYGGISSRRVVVTLFRLLRETTYTHEQVHRTKDKQKWECVHVACGHPVLSGLCDIAHLRMRAAPRGVAPRLASAAASSAAITSLSFTPCTNAHQMDIRLSLVHTSRLTRFACISARSVILGSSMHSPMNQSWVFTLGWVSVMQSPQMQLRPELCA